MVYSWLGNSWDVVWSQEIHKEDCKWAFGARWTFRLHNNVCACFISGGDLGLVLKGEAWVWIMISLGRDMLNIRCLADE